MPSAWRRTTRPDRSLRCGLSGPRRGRRPQLLVVEHDLDQRAAREPVVEVLAPADPRRDVGPVLQVEDRGDPPPSCRLVDRRRGRGQVGRDPVLEMHDEPWMGAHVRIPAAGSGHAGQVPATVDAVEPDLDAARDAGACTQRRDVDGALGRGGARPDGEGAGDGVVRGHSPAGRSSSRGTSPPSRPVRPTVRYFMLLPLEGAGEWSATFITRLLLHGDCPESMARSGTSRKTGPQTPG